MLHFGSRSASGPSTDAFARWFGRSRVVDAEGAPRVVYHHTHSEPFEVFDRFRGGRSGIDALGSWFTSLDTVLYGKHVRPFYLRIQNPILYEGKGAWRELYDDIARKTRTTEAKVKALRGEKLEDAAYKAGLRPRNGVWPTAHAVWQAKLQKVIEAWRNDRMKKGFDGVAILGDTFDGPKQDAWIVFDPGQVKAVANAGTWSDSDPRVSFNRTGSAALPPGWRIVVDGRSREFPNAALGRVRVTLWNARGRDVGEVQAAESDDGGVSLANDLCQQELAQLSRRLGRRLRVWIVSHSSLGDALVGKGYGRQMYEAALRVAAEQGAALAPSTCDVGATSQLAQALWTRLAKDHPSEGWVVWGGDASSGSRSQRTEPYVDYGTMTSRELDTQKTLQDRGLARRRDELAHLQQRRPAVSSAWITERSEALAWHQAERAHLEAERVRRGLR